MWVSDVPLVAKSRGMPLPVGRSWLTCAEREQAMRVSSVSLTILLAACLLAVSIYLAKTSITGTKEPVAVIAGQTIYEDELLPRVQAQLRNQEYELKSGALENLVDQKLLEAEAKKKGIAVGQVLEQEVDAKVAEPTEAELKAAYQSQKDNPNPPFEEVKAQVQQALKQAKLQEARQEFLKHLREQAGVSILLRPPKVEVGYDPARLRGNAWVSPEASGVITDLDFGRSQQDGYSGLLPEVFQDSCRASWSFACFSACWTCALTSSKGGFGLSFWL